MKNKKLLLSVLSTAVVASMASSAFAAEAGIYIGGDVKHYYNISSFFEPTNSAKIVSEANSAKLKNVVFVDTTGKAATLDNILASGSAALTDDLEAVFGDSLHDAYVPVDKNGQEGTDPVVPEPSDSPSVDGLTQVVDGGKVTISGNAVNADSVEVTVFKASEKVATKSVDVADNKFSVDFSDLVAGDYTYEVVASNADEDSEVKSGSFKVEAPAELKVDSVSAINLREVVVTFNNELDKTSAETVANYTTDNGVVFSNPKLGEDKKTVTLFAGANLSTTTDTNVTIKNVKDAKGTVVTETSKAVKGLDTAIPTVTSVTAVGPNTLEVTFSEPVQNAGAVGVDEVAYTIDSTPLTAANSDVNYVPGSNQRKVEIELSNALTAGEHTLKVNDGDYVGGTGAIEDFATYKVQPTASKFEVKVDTTIPAVQSAEVLDQQHVLVKFNKPVRLTEATDQSANFYWNTNGTENFRQYSADTTNTVTRVDAQTFKVSFTGSANFLRPGKDYFFVTGVTDFNGNTIQTSKTELNVVADSVVAITKVESATDSTIKLTFNRALDSTTATNKVNYEVKNSDGKVVAINTPGLGGTNNNEVTLTTTSTMPGGVYTVKAKGVKDTLGNVLAEVTNNVTVNDTTPIASISAAAVNGTNDKVIVSFPEAMATTGINGIGTKARYEVSVDGGTTFTTLASADTVTVVDSKKAEIKFATDKFNAGASIVVRVNLVSDASGNVIPNAISSAATTALDSTASQLPITNLVPKITGANTIELTVGRQLQSVSPADFLINDGTSDFAPADATFTNNATADNATIKFTVSGNLDLTKTYKVKTNAAVAGTKDITGILFAVNTTSASAVNQIAPNVKGFSVVENDKIRVVFDKDMGLVAPSDFRVTVGSSTQTPSNATKVSDKVWDLDITAIDVNATPSITTAANLQSEDKFGAKLNTLSAAATAANFKATALRFDQGAAVTIAGDETITITFSGSLDPESIKAGWDGTSSTTVSVVLDDNTPDTISLPGVGTVAFSSDVVAQDHTLAAATYELDGDNKLVVTLGGLVAADVNEGTPSTATFTPSVSVQNADGAYTNVDVTALTATQLADSTLTLTQTTPVKDENFVVTTNIADLLAADVSTPQALTTTYAALGANTGVEAKLNAALPTGVQDLKLAVTAATDTVTVSGTATAVVAPTDIVISVKNPATGLVQEITVTVSAAGAGALTVVTK